MTLQEAWDDLEAALTAAGYHVADHVPPAVEPPLVIMSTADPYLVKSDTLGTEAIVTLELFLVFEAAEGSQFTTAVNAAVGSLITVSMTAGEGWEFEGCSAPFRATNAGGLPSVRVRVSTPVDLTQEG